MLRPAIFGTPFLLHLNPGTGLPTHVFLRPTAVVPDRVPKIWTIRRLSKGLRALPPHNYSRSSLTMIQKVLLGYLLPEGRRKHPQRQIIDRMKESHGLHLKTYLFIFLIVIFAPLGNTLLGKGMKSVGQLEVFSPGALLETLIRIAASGYIWLGIASLLAFFVAYMLVLTWADYSYVQPASSFSYAVVAILSYWLLGEIVTPLRWLGILVICVGVLIVGRTHPRTTQDSTHA